MSTSLLHRPGMAASPDNRSGMLLMLAGVFCYAVMSVAARRLGSQYSASQVLLFRCLAALPLLPVLVGRAGGWSILKTARPGLHLSRILLGLGAMYGIFKAFSILPLTDAMAVIFTYPLFMAALSIALLGERIDVRRWVAIGAGFVGMIIIVKPDADALVKDGALYAIGAALCMAVSLIEGRRITRSDHPVSIIFWFTLVGTVVGAACSAAEGFVMPSPADLLLLCLIGISGCMGQYLVAQAFRVGEVSVVAPLEYTRLLWGALFGWLLLGEIPEPRVGIGAAILVASGLYNLYQRQR